MVRTCLWFIPIIPPTSALIPAISVMKKGSFNGRVNASIDSGAIFCHVDRIKQDTHEIEAITDGYQKWQGTLPNFKRTALVSKTAIRLGINENCNHNAMLDVRSTADPRAWARKYFTAPSVSWLFLVWSIIGINLSKFSSMAPHSRIQFDLDRAIIVLENIASPASAIVGE